MSTFLKIINQILAEGSHIDPNMSVEDVILNYNIFVPELEKITSGLSKNDYMNRDIMKVISFCKRKIIPSSEDIGNAIQFLRVKNSEAADLLENSFSDIKKLEEYEGFVLPYINGTWKSLSFDNNQKS